jgi:hypothetical protein
MANAARLGVRALPQSLAVGQWVQVAVGRAPGPRGGAAGGRARRRRGSREQSRERKGSCRGAGGRGVAPTGPARARPRSGRRRRRGRRAGGRLDVLDRPGGAAGALGGARGRAAEAGVVKEQLEGGGAGREGGGGQGWGGRAGGRAAADVRGPGGTVGYACRVAAAFSVSNHSDLEGDDEDAARNLEQEGDPGAAGRTGGQQGRRTAVMGWAPGRRAAHGLCAPAARVLRAAQRPGSVRPLTTRRWRL